MTSKNSEAKIRTWAKVSKKNRKAKGVAMAKARWATKTPEQKKAHALKMAIARWGIKSA